jgi:hypothetical protein
MKIERALFLALTGTLAAGCYVVEHPPPPPPPLPPATQTAAATTGSPHLAPLQARGATPGPAPAPHAAPHLEPLRPGPGVLPPAPGPSPSPTPTTPVPTPPAPQPPTACLDSAAVTVPACTVKCSTNAFMAQRCATYAADMDSKVAASSINCMNGLTGAAACDSTQAYGCGKTALTNACADSTVAQLCQIAATPCKVAANDCVTMLSGLNPTGQDAVAQCVAKGCSAGLYSCIEGLSSTSAGH